MIELFTDILLRLNNVLGNNLGLTIIVIAVLPRVLLHPLLASSLRYTRKLQELKPKLDQLKKRYGKDMQTLVREQNKIFKEAGINQATGSLGCFLNTLIQIGVFILLFQSLSRLIASGVETHFLIWDLAVPNIHQLDQIPFPLPGILVIITALLTFVQSKMVLPAPSPKKDTAGKQKESDFSDALANTQSQTAFIIPIIILFTGIRFPAGLALYWLVSTLFAIIQQYFITGLGGIEPWLKILKKN